MFFLIMIIIILSKYINFILILYIYIIDFEDMSSRSFNNS